MTQSEAVEVARVAGYTETPSWKDHGRYVSTKPSSRLTELLRPYLMSAERWKDKIEKTLAGSAQNGL